MSGVCCMAYPNCVHCAPLPNSAPTPDRDWPEDAADENGEYQNRCFHCGETLIGNKRRPVCKVCASDPTPDAPLVERLRAMCEAPGKAHPPSSCRCTPCEAAGRLRAAPERACATCGAPPTCYGAYEGHPPAYGCDVCCGHGNEDGWCNPVASPAAQPERKALCPLADEWEWRAGRTGMTPEVSATLRACAADLRIASPAAQPGPDNQIQDGPGPESVPHRRGAARREYLHGLIEESQDRVREFMEGYDGD